MSIAIVNFSVEYINESGTYGDLEWGKEYPVYGIKIEGHLQFLLYVNGYWNWHWANNFAPVEEGGNS